LLFTSGQYIFMHTRGWRDSSDYYDDHQVTWKRGGPDFFQSVVDCIDSAEKTIHFQVYIIIPDSAGKPVFKALIRAAERGVKVYLVVDDFGSDKIEEEEEKLLVDAGIHFKRFEPLLASKRFYVGRRMHHKVLVIDQKKAMVCGLNIADRYRGNKKIPAWLDYGVFVEGPVCKLLDKACYNILERNFNPPRPKLRLRKSRVKTLDPSKVWVRMRKNDWLRNKREITTSYNKAARLATKSITIVGGYFLPGRKFRRILGEASKRKVDVKIILTKYSDVQIVKYAGEYLYGWMLRNNIRIFEYKKSMVHGKVAVVDDMWATVGSYNQNHLSAYLSIELNLDIVNSDFAKDLNAHLHQVIDQECTEITTNDYYKGASVFVKFRRWYSYQLVRFSLRMLFVMNRIFKVND
jgi:cardiolipin synthase A/B